MKLKANFHFHVKGDVCEFSIKYTLREGIDYAAASGFGVLAVTPHLKMLATDEDVKYAALKGILLIKGVEVEPNNKHVVILNCNEDAEKIKTFEDLRNFRNKYPESFILAAHPFYHGFRCLKEELEKNINLFDAIELSWFYSEFFNGNKKAEEIAKKYNIPFMATSDTHILEFLNKNYAVLDVEEKTISAVFKSIRQKKFENITSQSRFFRDIVWKWGKFAIRGEWLSLKKRLFSK